MDEYGPWLRDTDIPKLVLAATPGLLINKDEVRRIEETFANTTIVEIGKGLHFVQEDQPDTIGTEMARWLGTVQRATTAVE
jgi:haloalkane dehalogenase